MARTEVARMGPVIVKISRGVLLGGLIWFAALLSCEWLARFYFDRPLADFLLRLILDLSFSIPAGILAVFALER